MQLGSRFSVGETPKGLPEDLIQRMREVESTLSDEQRDKLRWTLTWLENRPIVELDDGIRLKA